jgi:hypothetical protein
MMIDVPGFHKVVTSLYPEGDEFLSSDPVFGVKKSLVVVSVWLVVVHGTGSGLFVCWH